MRGTCGLSLQLLLGGQTLQVQNGDAMGAPVALNHATLSQAAEEPGTTFRQRVGVRALPIQWLL